MERLRIGGWGKREKVVGLGSAPVGAPVAPKHAPAMEVAHILFLDVVGYSKLRTLQQADVQRELQHQIQSVGEVVQARQQGKLIVRPTGDGAALLFLRDMLSPLRCAIHLQTLLRQNDVAIRARIGTSLSLRMGIHSGPVILTEDLNSQSDVAGEGINMAQRVMDCGDAGHILLSANYAEHLRQVDPWSRYLHDIGVCHVKHNRIVGLYNFYGKFDGIACGSPQIPARVQAGPRPASSGQPRLASLPKPTTIIACAAVTLLLGVANLWTTSKDFRQAVGAAYAHLVPSSKSTPVAHRNLKEHNRAKAEHSVRPSQAALSPAEATLPRVRTTAPNIVGMTFAEAEGYVEEQNLHLARSKNSGYSIDYSEGQIYQQSPPAGSVIQEGKTVYVRVSKGEPTEATPAPTESPDALESPAPASNPPSGAQ